jgi:hypothetical protein
VNGPKSSDDRLVIVTISRSGPSVWAVSEKTLTPVERLSSSAT